MTKRSHVKVVLVLVAAAGLAIFSATASASPDDTGSEDATYDSYLVELDGPEDSTRLDQAAEAADPLSVPGVNGADRRAPAATEADERAISERLGDRGITYNTDATDLDGDTSGHP